MSTLTQADSLLDAAKALVVRLRNLGIGSEQPVSGADCVETCGEHLEQLEQAIAIEEQADVKPSKSNRRVLIVTESAYNTIIETLEMDSESGAFDRNLRAQIKRALRAIEEVAPKVRIDVRGGVAYVGQSPSFVEVRIVDHDNH